VDRKGFGLNQDHRLLRGGQVATVQVLGEDKGNRIGARPRLEVGLDVQFVTGAGAIS